MNSVSLEHLGHLAVILMVEDNEDHILLAQLAFEEAKLNVDLRVVHDGVECLDFLHRRGEYADAPRPDLILLDIHMPRMDGYTVLAHIRADETLRELPVVVLSTSADLVDVKRMHALGCNSYIIKPVNFDRFVAVTRQMAGYWLNLVVLPTTANY